MQDIPGMKQTLPETGIFQQSEVLGIGNGLE